MCRAPTWALDIPARQTSTWTLGLSGSLWTLIEIFEWVGAFRSADRPPPFALTLFHLLHEVHARREGSQVVGRFAAAVRESERRGPGGHARVGVVFGRVERFARLSSGHEPILDIADDHGVRDHCSVFAWPGHAALGGHHSRGGTARTGNVAGFSGNSGHILLCSAGWGRLGDGLIDYRLETSVDLA